MKKRNLLLVFVLSIVTLGIYFLYWLYSTRKDAVKLLNDPKAIPPVIMLFSPFLLFILALFLNLPFRGSDSGNVLPSIISLVAVVAIFTVPLWWFYKYCHGIDRVTRGTEPMLLYILFIVMGLVGVSIVWMILVQNDINKALARPAQTPPAPGPLPPAGPVPHQPWQQQPPVSSPTPPTPYTPPQPHMPPPQPAQHPHPPAQPEEHTQNLPPPVRPA